MLPLGQTITLWRKACGLTQAELAQKSGISRPNLSVIEQEGRDVTVGTLRRLAEALGVSPGILADGTPPKDFQKRGKLSRQSLDRIARWVVSRKEKIKAPRLSGEEKEIALWFYSLTRPRRRPASSHENFLKAKISLEPEEIKNLLGRIQKLSEYAL